MHILEYWGSEVESFMQELYCLNTLYVTHITHWYGKFRFGVSRYGTYLQPRATDLDVINRYSPYTQPAVTDKDVINTYGRTDKQLDPAILNPAASGKMELAVISEWTILKAYLGTKT